VSGCPCDSVADNAVPLVTLLIVALPVPSNESEAVRVVLGAALHAENSPKSMFDGVVKATPFFCAL
jgi:hypothetical protein